MKKKQCHKSELDMKDFNTQEEIKMHKVKREEENLHITTQISYDLFER
jgi:hypothetical protein